MAEALRAIICSKSAISLQRGPVDPKFQVEWVAPTNHSFSQKTRLNDLLYGVKIWTDFFAFCHNPYAFARQTDGRTDGQTQFSSLDPVCIPCSAVIKPFKHDIHACRYIVFRWITKTWYSNIYEAEWKFFNIIIILY